MKPNFIILSLFALVGMILLIGANSTTNTVAFHSSDLNQVQKIITDYSKAGFTVKTIVSQSLTNTYGGRTSCGGDCQVVRGELFIVMTK